MITKQPYLLPFFWQHGENEAVLREEMARIHEAAIGAVCVVPRQPATDVLPICSSFCNTAGHECETDCRFGGFPERP